jgi:acyl-CoA synthetase (AMP-forming)/AMP-acid ligase II
MPFFWVGGFLFSVACNLEAGATALVEEAFEPGATLAFLEKERATYALGWPHFGKLLAEHPTRPQRDLSALRRGNMPGLLPEVPDDPELRATALGMTETFGPHTWGGEGALAEADRGSFGPPLPYVEHRIVDPASGVPVAPGEAGEICVRGRTLMQGLYKVEREDAFDADGFYHTGDVGFLDRRGRLFFQGRLGDMIKTGGANVTPSEVETALAAYAEVKAAYVVGVPDAERGQNVAAAVVLEPGAPAVSADELQRRLRADLSAYKVPRHLWVLRDDELPFTDTGKLHKGRLAALLADRLARDDRA